MFYALISFELPSWFPFPLHSYNLSSFFYLLSYWLIFWEREGYCVCKYELYILYITCLYKVVYWPFPTSSPPPPSYIHQYHGNRIPLSHSFKPWSPVKLSHRQPTFHSPDTHVLPTIPPSGHLISSHRPFPLTKCWLCTLCKIVVCMCLSFG